MTIFGWPPLVIPLTPNVMGSPLLNLRGEMIGINIARADRVTSYAIPVERVILSVRRMIGDLRYSQQTALPVTGLGRAESVISE